MSGHCFDSFNSFSIINHLFICCCRTGMLVMLLQSLLGIPDDHIIEDYFLSNRLLRGRGSAAADGVRKWGKLDRKFFTGTNREAMLTTLSFLRSKYGSIAPGYLDSIGFDENWRRRLARVLVSSQRSKL